MTDRDFVIEEVSDPDERSGAPEPRMNVTAAIVRGCRRTGGMSYRRPVASLSLLRDKKRSSQRRRRKRGPGSRRHTQRIMAPSSAMSGPREGHASLLIVGEWQVGDDGVTRPIVRPYTVRFVFPEPDGGAMVKVSMMHIAHRQFYRDLGWGEKYW